MSETKTCDLCGTPVKVAGNPGETRYYEPIGITQETARELLEELKHEHEGVTSFYGKFDDCPVCALISKASKELA